MVAIADELGRIPMSADLAASLSRAAEYAQAQSHDEVQLEHLLLALTEDSDATSVLAASHVDVGLLKADVSSYLGGLTDRIAAPAAVLAIATDLKRILEAAAAAANQGRRRDINGAIVLAAIVGDGRSPAAHMLRAQGLTFEEAIRALQRSLAQPTARPAPAPAPVAPPAVVAEDLLAAARARVQSRAPILAPPASTPAPVQPLATVPPPQQNQAVSQGDSRPPSAGWPPDVRSSSDSAADDPVLEDDLAAAGGNTGDDWQQDASGPFPTRGAGLPFDGADAPFSPSFPPPLPANASAPPRRGQPAADVGTRWPAPVAPAWMEAPSHPPPLPPEGPSYQPYAEVAPYADDGGTWPPQFGPAASDEPMNVGYGDRSYGPPDGQGPDSMGTWPPDNGYDRASRTAAEWNGALPTDGRSGPALGPPIYPERSDAGSGRSDLAPLRAPPLADERDGVPTTRGRRRRRSPDTAARAMGEAIPRRMRAGVATQIEVQLPKAEVHAIVAGLHGRSDTDWAQPSQPPAMSVRLRSPDGAFLIDPSTSETLWFDPRSDIIQSEFANWRWTVTPLRSGRRVLQLAIAVRADGVDGVASDHALPDQVVDVRVRRTFGRAFGTLIKWIMIASIGAAVAKFAPLASEPLQSFAAKLIGSKL